MWEEKYPRIGFIPKFQQGKQLFGYIENNLDVSTFFVLPIFFSRGLLPIIQRPFRGIVWWVVYLFGDDDFFTDAQVPTQHPPPPPPPKKVFWRTQLGCGNSNIFGIFTPKLGEDFHPFCTCAYFSTGLVKNHQPVTFWWLGVWLWMCQLGWFNHQPESCYATGPSSTSSFIHPSRVQLDALAELRNGKEGGDEWFQVEGWRVWGFQG